MSASLSFVKEGDEAAAEEAEQERKIIDKRPLAVILQANREAKEAEQAAKLKARDQLLTVTDDDVAFESDRDRANQRRQEAVAMETQRALDEFRTAVAERVVSVAVESNSNSNTASVPSNVVKNSAAKRPVESALAPILPPVKKAAVQVKPSVQVKKSNAKPSSSVSTSAHVDKKPSVSAGIGLLGAYDSSDSDD